MAFGFAIKKLREDAGISVDKLTALIGVKAARWRKWEEKDFDPRDGDQAIIESFFRLNLEEIGKLKSIKDFLKVQNTSKGGDSILSDMTHGQILSSLLQANKDYAEGFKSLAKVMERIEDKMAQETTQAIVLKKVKDLETNLNDLAEKEGYFQAFVEGAVRRSAQRIVKEDPDQLEIEMSKIDMLAGVYHRASVKKDKLARKSKQ